MQIMVLSALARHPESFGPVGTGELSDGLRRSGRGAPRRVYKNIQGILHKR
jgi:hypothetical protein